MRQRGTLAFREAPQKASSQLGCAVEELESFRKLTPAESAAANGRTARRSATDTPE